MRRLSILAGLSFVLLFGQPRVATAASILFSATNLPDVPGGGDLWEYEYSLDDLSTPLLSDQGFAVFFDYTLYDMLHAPTAPAGWSPLVANPIPATQSDGFYDALALVNAPPNGPFQVRFTWKGAAGSEPGSQPFEIYQLDFTANPDGTPVAFETGFTVPFQTPPVPEPSILILLTTGALVTRTLRRWS
jgi:hypothetical protein